MLKQISHQVAGQVRELVTWLRGYEESGHINIDSVSLLTRDQLEDLGVL